VAAPTTAPVVCRSPIGVGVVGGLYGSVDLGDLLDGDVRPVVDPMALYNPVPGLAGPLDAAVVLGGRDDGLTQLRR